MIASLSKFDSRRLSLPSETESKKRSMIKELRVDYRKCFTNSALSSTAKRFSPTTRQANHVLLKDALTAHLFSRMPHRFFLFVFRFASFLVPLLAAGLAYCFIPDISITT